MTWEKFFNFFDYRMGYSMDGNNLCFCIVNDEKGIGFTSASIPDLNNFFCMLDKPKVQKLIDGTIEIKIVFCHAEKEEDSDQNSYAYWYDVYLFDPVAFTVSFKEHEIIDQTQGADI